MKFDEMYKQLLCENDNTHFDKEDIDIEKISKHLNKPVEIVKAALEKGIKVEEEHNDLFNILKKEIPDLDSKWFYSMIAAAHIKEFVDYYDYLSDMEKRATKKEHQQDTGDKDETE